MAAQALGTQAGVAEQEATSGPRRQSLLAVAAVMLVAGGGLLAAVSQYAGAKRQLVAELETGADRFETVFREAVESRLQSLRLGADILARDESIAGALARRDRTELSQRTVNFYNDVLAPRFRLSILGFQTPEGITFFRAHRPSLLGDDASARTAVATALKSRVSIAGIELGRIGPELRAVTPIVLDDKLVGSVELGSGVLEPLQVASRATGLDFAFAVDEKASEALDRPYNPRTDVLRTGALYFAFSRPEIREILQGAAFDPASPEPRIFEASDRTTFAQTIPVNDIGGRPMTRITLLRDLTAQLADLRTSIALRTTAIGTSILLLVLFGLFRFRSLRAGLERSFSGRLQELREKAHAYDALRQRLRDVDAWKIAIVNELVLLLKDPLVAIQGALETAGGAQQASRTPLQPTSSALTFAAAEIRRLRAALDSQLEVIGLRNGWRSVATERVTLGALAGNLPGTLPGGTPVTIVGETADLQVAGDRALLRSAFAAVTAALDRLTEADTLSFQAELRGSEIVGRLAGPGRWRADTPRLDDTAPLGSLAAGEPDDGLAAARAVFERLGGSLDVVATPGEVGFNFTLRPA
ncbi:cache domain-containing protein [uncultured Enterovirga sp.]|uniref:cache domain-containing protein n=1 Tax=uncultured Enterovirga sp. TaxID=2026352 RepID=UPI0035CB5050